MPGVRRLFLSPNVFGVLVVAQAEIHGMTQHTVACPLGELDLRDERRRDPVRPLVRLRRRLERTTPYFDWLEPLHQTRELALVEAGADVSRVNKVTLAVHADEQRAEVRAGLPRLGPAADHEFLFVHDLQLAPVGRPLARQIARLRAFGDQSFPSAIEGALIQRAAVAVRDVADTQDR